MDRTAFLLFLFLIFFGLSGCMPSIEPIDIPTVTKIPEIKTSEKSSPTTISFEKVIVEIKPNTVIGTFNPKKQKIIIWMFRPEMNH